MLAKTAICYQLAMLSVTMTLAQPATFAKLDSLFVSLDLNKKAMGSLAISKSGSMVYTRSIGYRFYSASEKITADERTKYRVGSISKMFTAVIIFQLIEEGKITLHSALSEYFPEFRNAGEITIANLLNHTSGIPNIKHINCRGRPRTEGKMLQIISRTGGWSGPDTISSYSNSNYLLLGYIIERITGQPYSRVLEERILSKIGLKDTYFGDRTNVTRGESFSYCLRKDWRQQRQTHLSIPGASGGIVSTPTDLVHFIEALFSCKLVSRASLEQMKMISSGDYGMGLFLFKLDQRHAFGHPGGIDRFESVVAYFPDDSLAIAYCSNGQVYPVRSIVISALNIYFRKPYSVPEFKPVIANSRKLKKFEGAYHNTEAAITVNITNHKNILIANADGLPSFELYPVALNVFRCDEANVVVEFDPGNSQMKLNREGRTFSFVKEN